MNNLIDSHLVNLDVYGYTMIENVLQPDRIAAIKRVLQDLESRSGEVQLDPSSEQHILTADGSSRTVSQALLRNLPTRHQVFLPLIDEQAVIGIMEKILGRDIILASLHARILPPGQPAQQLHSDVPALLKRPGAPIALTGIWLLDDFTEHNGATRFVPGSHKSKYPGPPETHLPLVVPIIAPAGTVVVYDGRCWHSAGHNRSDQRRYALFAQYRIAHWMRFQWDPHVGFPADWWPSLTRRQRDLLRMIDGVGTPSEADAYD